MELPDELDVFIAQRDFGSAISMIEKARHIISECQGETKRLHIIRTTVNQRTTAISKLISMNLINPASTKSQIQEDIQRLQKLGLGSQARDIYLSTRSGLIRKRMRQLQFNGDIISYVMDYSEIFFRLIRNTCEWFSLTFHDASMVSGFMKWIQNEILNFSEIFKKQVFGMGNPFGTVIECCVVTLEKCSELNQIGMDLAHTFEKLLFDDLANCVNSNVSACIVRIEEHVLNDTLEDIEIDAEMFEANNLPLKLPLPKLSSSIGGFYKILTEFGADIGPLLSINLYNSAVNGLGKFFKSFINSMKFKSESKLSIDQVTHHLI